MRRLWIVVFLFTCDVLFAQERSDTSLYLFPAAGGTQTEREFFDKNIHDEIKGANYKIVYTPEEADYTVTLKISEYEDPETPGVAANQLTLFVARTSDNSPVVEFSWSYHALEEMYQWNLYIVYNALANVTLMKPESPEAEARRLDSWFYLGPRAGASLPGYSFKVSPGYEAGSGDGFGGEGGLVAELRLFPFFGLQLEALFACDAFNAVKITSGEDSRTVSADMFTSMSLMFPFLLKVPLGFEKFVLSFCAGAYYLLFSPWGEGESGGGFSMSFPLGFIIGADLGIPLGPGELFVDLRYGKDHGVTVIQNGPRYGRDRINVGLGYKFGFFKK